jgi:phosphoribosylformimino-5-aminoimidazole carboxamide ribotide isomerase
MRIVPVIDLLGGQAVHARRGDRANYRPVQSALVAGSDPVDVARALITAAHAAQQRLGMGKGSNETSAHAESDTDRLYVADLDALQGRGVQHAAIAALLAGLPGVQLWLDAGFGDPDAAAALVASLGDAGQRLRPVYASEALASRAALARCTRLDGDTGRQRPGAILSLDRRGSERLDPAGCWKAPELWPDDLIVMTLERVGAGSGPALDTLGEVAAQARACGQTPRLWGAGGMRDLADLRQASDAGASGWLIATALHEGRLV